MAVLELSRNFGKEVALSAGLDHAGGEAVILIDADLQDPPETLPRFLELYREGYDVVYARRVARKERTFRWEGRRRPERSEVGAPRNRGVERTIQTPTAGRGGLRGEKLSTPDARFSHRNSRDLTKASDLRWVRRRPSLHPPFPSP